MNILPVNPIKRVNVILKVSNIGKGNIIGEDEIEAVLVNPIYNKSVIRINNQLSVT
ncbi:hypothetical protein SVI_1674 [Shewanella violacea DSS12]|uniref:Uncharacterized protein n=1 Tax=Shewanella violacea (strain JCM 10179 / CIP 106290 / LMG 19151 / DSS12) TaxID=637905 RepID=D4ZIZ6_SHEVD|nr:hypothetical protein SVI_1674 [Shewanella violacea DSS12]